MNCEFQKTHCKIIDTRMYNQIKNQKKVDRVNFLHFTGFHRISQDFAGFHRISQICFLFLIARLSSGQEHNEIKATEGTKDKGLTFYQTQHKQGDRGHEYRQEDGGTNTGYILIRSPYWLPIFRTEGTITGRKTEERTEGTKDKGLTFYQTRHKQGDRGHDYRQKRRRN